MTEKEAREQKYKCRQHGTPLEESRGDYYCPTCLFDSDRPMTWEEAHHALTGE